jgi:hypothetical protein
MADETAKPLDTLKATEQSLDSATKTETISPISDREVDENLVVDRSEVQVNRPELSPEESTAAERLRAFEDREFGKDAVRINDRIERGYGSKFKNMVDSDPRKAAEYAALERMVEAELVLADADGKRAQAQADYDAAVAALDAAESEVNGSHA